MNWSLTILSSLLLASHTFANVNEELIVETSYGRLQGITVETNAGKKASVFLGIPYAKPPLAELRFEVSLASNVQRNHS